MTVSAELSPQGAPLRLEKRQSVVHVVEYSRYPRRLASENRRVAYTQDRSDTGLGLDLPERVTPGELLQVTVRDIDGQVAVDGLARVVWCKEYDGGHARAGVSILQETGQRLMLRVRRRSPLATRSDSNSHALGSG